MFPRIHLQALASGSDLGDVISGERLDDMIAEAADLKAKYSKHFLASIKRARGHATLLQNHPHLLHQYNMCILLLLHDEYSCNHQVLTKRQRVITCSLVFMFNVHRRTIFLGGLQSTKLRSQSIPSYGATWPIRLPAKLHTPVRPSANSGLTAPLTPQLQGIH